MPPVSEEMFLEAVGIRSLQPNKGLIPESGGASLPASVSLRGPVIGVKPSDEYQFRLFGTPVGSYFKNGVKPITICVSDYDRAAPHGTGNIKAGLNYAMSLYPYILAHQRGFDENMYLDAATRTYVEETGGANFLFVTKDGKLVTPKSDSILPSITRRSLVTIAEHLGYTVEHRLVKFTELTTSAEGLASAARLPPPLRSARLSAMVRRDRSSRSGMGRKWVLSSRNSTRSLRASSPAVEAPGKRLDS